MQLVVLDVYGSKIGAWSHHISVSPAAIEWGDAARSSVPIDGVCGGIGSRGDAILYIVFICNPVYVRMVTGKTGVIGGNYNLAHRSTKVNVNAVV